MIDIDIIGQLIPNPLTVIVQLCSTLVLFLVIKKFLWKSVMNFMNQRADKMQAELAESEQAKQAALSDREQAKEQLKEASATSQKIVEAARKEAGSQRDEILAKANTQADSVRKKAQEQIQSERREMQASMQKEMVEVALDAAGKLIGEKSSTELDRKAVDAFVKEAQSNGK